MDENNEQHEQEKSEYTMTWYEDDYVRAIAQEPSNVEMYDKYKKWLKSEIDRRLKEKSFSSRVDYSLKLRFLEAQDEGKLEEMQRYAAECNPNWLAIVSRPEVINCGRPNPEEDEAGQRWWNRAKSSHKEPTYQEWKKNHPRFEMEFVCHKKWNEMKPTENRKVRFCEDCKKNVYFCDNIMEARELGQQGCCIGIDVGVKRRKDDLHGESAIFGRPSPEYVEENKERALPDRISAKRILKKMEKHLRGKTTPGPASASHNYQDRFEV